MTFLPQQFRKDVLRALALATVAGAATFAGCATGDDTATRPSGRPNATGLGGGGTGGSAETGGSSATGSGGSAANGGSAGGTSAGTGGASGSGSGSGGSSGAGASGGAGGSSGSGGSAGSGGTSGSNSGGSGGSAGSSSSGTGGGPPVSTTLPYNENFDDGTANGWMANVDDNNELLGQWGVVPDGTGMAYESQTVTSNDTWAVGGDYRWTDVHLESKVKFVSGSANGTVTLVVRFTNFKTYAFIEINATRVKIRVKSNGATIDVGVQYKFPTPLIDGTWYTFGLSAAGTNLTSYYNGMQVITGPNPYPADVTTGGIALTVTDSVVAFDDVSVTAP